MTQTTQRTKSLAPTLSLETVLTQMFAEASASGQPTSRSVARGLHLKTIVRPSGRKEVLLWRTQDRFPSGKECDIVARDGGFVEPKFKPWLCEGIDGFHLRDVADWQHPCTHTWGAVMFLDGRSESGTSRSCTRCKTTAGTMHKRRGKSTVFLYNEHEVSEATYARATVTGPMPSSLDVAEKQRLRAEMAGEILSVLDIPPLPAPSAPASWQTAKPRERPKSASQQATEAAQQAREEAQRQRLVGVLVLCAQMAGLRHPWFHRPAAQEARRDYLKTLKLQELREECRGRWGRDQQRLALPMLRQLLIGLRHWLLIFRALPVETAE